MWTAGMLAVGGLATVVGAHPFDDGLAGHRLRLEVSEAQIAATFLVEEPLPWVLRDLRRFLADVPSPGPADQARYTARRLSELETGLQLSINGESVPWERVSDELREVGENGVVVDRFVVYELRLVARLPTAGSVAVHVVDTAHAGESVARSTEVWGGAGVDLRGCSLWTDLDGEPAADRSGKWDLSEEPAEHRVTVRKRSGAERVVVQVDRWLRGEGTLVRQGPDGEPSRSVMALLVAVFLLLCGGLVAGVWWHRR